MTSKYITRKEIAVEIEETVDVVRKNEKKWGLDKCRAGFSKPIKFFRDKAMQILKSKLLTE